MANKERFGFNLTERDSELLAQLAEIEGGLSQAAVIRRLIRIAAYKHGLLKNLRAPSTEPLREAQNE